MALDHYFRPDIQRVLSGLAATADHDYRAQGSANLEYWNGKRDAYREMAIAFGIPPERIADTEREE